MAIGGIRQARPCSVAGAAAVREILATDRLQGIRHANAKTSGIYQGEDRVARYRGRCEAQAPQQHGGWIW